jgi:hypothetical protein
MVDLRSLVSQMYSPQGQYAQEIIAGGTVDEAMNRQRLAAKIQRQQSLLDKERIEKTNRALAKKMLARSGGQLNAQQFAQLAATSPQTASVLFKMQDMQRKKAKEAQRQELLGNILGGQATGGAETTPEQIAAAGMAIGDPSLMQYAEFLQKSGRERTKEEIETAEREATRKKKQRGAKTVAGQLNLVGDTIDKAISQLEEESLIAPRTGFMGEVASLIPGTGAKDFASTLQTINANIGFDKLQAIRDASPTGGALGAVSERELTNLQAVYANLSQSQGDEQLMENLKTLKSVYSTAIKNIKDAYKQDFGSLEGFDDYFIKTEEQPINLPEGARQAADGNYYIERNGQFFKVDF